MSRTTFYQAQYIDWPPVAIGEYANPDSLYWQEQAETAVARFDEKAPEAMTENEWRRFNELAASHYGENYTWKAAYETYQKALEHLAPGATADSLAYACGVLPEIITP
jgi:hypothetical protein